MKQVPVLTAVLLTTLVLAPLAGAGERPASGRKLDRALQQALARGDQPRLRVIIRTTPEARGALRDKLRKRQARIHSDHPFVSAVAATVTAADLAVLAGDPTVLSISADAVVRGFQNQSRVAPKKPGTAGDARKATAQATNPATADTKQASTGTADAVPFPTTNLIDTLGLAGSKWTGLGIGVAVIDSGIAARGDIAPTRFFDFTQGGSEVAPYDDFGHGTHVAGLIASSSKDAQGRYLGVAPKARLIGMKVLDGTGAGYTSAVVQAVEYAVASRETLGIDVLNLSLGHPIYEPAATDPLVQAVEAAVRAGIVVVVSAGNFGVDPATGEAGYAGITSPGNAPSAITVGAINHQRTTTRTDDVVAPYSSRGPSWYDGFAKPDLVAPGHKLVSNAVPGSYLALADAGAVIAWRDTDFIALSGTSMAAGVVSGVVATVLEASRNVSGLSAPPLPPNAVKAILEYTAFDMAGDDALAEGAGSINADGATTLAASLDLAMPQSAPWLATSVTPATTIGAETLAWSERVVWGDRVVWGNQVFYNDPAWAQRVVWGDRVVWGNVEANRVVWGTSVVWTDDAIWADRVVWGNSALGYRLDGTAVVWGDRVVWGNVSADRVVWGNLASAIGMSSTSTPKGTGGR
jgi:serine protease AprX